MERIVGADTSRAGLRVRAESMLRAGSATLLTFWATIVVGFSLDAAPYETASWPSPVEAIVLFALIGAAGGLVATAGMRVVAPVAGYVAAVAVQLFVLTGQASWEPNVASSVSDADWLPGVASALGLALIGIVAGSLAAPPIAARIRGRGAGPPSLVGSIAAIAGAVALVAVLLVDASGSTYVVPADESELEIEFVDGRVAVDPATFQVGRITIVAPGIPDSMSDVQITWPLTPEQVADLDRGRLRASTMAYVLDGHRLEMAPGIYAVVVIDPDWDADPAWDGTYPLLDATTFEVTGIDGSAAPVRGEGGAVQVAGFVVALTIHALAVAGVVGGTSVVRRLRRTPPADPNVRGAVTVAAVVAAFDTVLVGGLILLAIDVAHNPF